MARASDSASPPRRSTRAKKPVVFFGQEDAAVKEASPPAKRHRSKTTSPTQAKGKSKSVSPASKGKTKSASPAALAKGKAASPSAQPGTKAASSQAAPSYPPADDLEAAPPSSPVKAKASPKAQAKPAAAQVAEEAQTEAEAADGNGKGAHPQNRQVKQDPADLHSVLQLGPGELEEYEGWTELESDPAHFNYILNNLGVYGVRCEEVLAIDEATVKFLRQPIHGFIFLFECDEAPEAEQTVDPPDGMWFARQTIANACASVALFNILMNVQGVSLGDGLQKFKNETASMIPPHRGAALAQNRLARRTHNTFARRLDLMDEDLCLSNNYDEFNQKKRKKGTAIKAKGKQNKKRKIKEAIDPNSAKHYVAYIERAGKLWELDGLEDGAILLGTAGDDWINKLIPHILDKVNSLGGLQANLIALCHSPQAEVRQRLAANVSAIVALQKAITEHQEWDVSLGEDFKWTVPGRLDAYVEELIKIGLTIAEVDDAGGGEKLEADEPGAEKDGDYGAEAAELVANRKHEPKREAKWTTAEEAKDAAQQLVETHRRLADEFSREQDMVADDIGTARQRQTDLTPLVHSWVEALCDADVLDSLSDAVAAGAADGH